MRNGFPAVLKPVAGLEREGILPPLFIDQMNALAWLKCRHTRILGARPWGCNLSGAVPLPSPWGNIPIPRPSTIAATPKYNGLKRLELILY